MKFRNFHETKFISIAFDLIIFKLSAEVIDEKGCSERE